MNQVKVMTFGLMNVRVVDMQGTPWFLAADVARALTLKNTSVAVKALAPDEYSKFNLGQRGLGAAIVISESGVYKLVMRSDKPEAKAFQDWVTRVVLPAIRKDGAYVMGEEKVATGELSEDELVMRAMTIMTRKVDRLTQERDQLARDKLWSCTDQVR